MQFDYVSPRLTPYLHVGAGRMFNNVQNVSELSGMQRVNFQGPAWVANIGFGLRYQLSAAWDLTLHYDHFWSPSDLLDGHDENNRVNKSTDHLGAAMLGVHWRLGARRRPAGCPARAPAAPAAPGPRAPARHGR